MAGRHVPRTNPTDQVQLPSVADARAQRAFEVLASAVKKLQNNTGEQALPVTGSRSGGDALANLLTALEQLGIIADETEA